MSAFIYIILGFPLLVTSIHHHSGSAEFNFLCISQQIYKSQDIFFSRSPESQKFKSVDKIRSEVKAMSSKMPPLVHFARHASASTTPEQSPVMDSLELVPDNGTRSRESGSDADAGGLM